ncbi:hypothetical protein [Novosphingobium malaysiense]|uniref:hypothetical protein n=1 Tax=Novosphingobium malaysiense TaxID=1348853 RepID=UPI0012E02D3C|nr:hypothetical protein [Novosphingobium malaysiense]
MTGIAFLVWGLFRLAAVALPVAAGFCAFLLCARGQAGPLAGLVLGVLLAAVVLILGRLALASRLPLVIRGGVAALFAIPAGMAGYSVAAGLMQLGGAGPFASTVAACMASLATGIAALASLAVPQMQAGTPS